MSDLSNIKDNTLQLNIVSRNSKCCYILKQTYLMKQKNTQIIVLLEKPQTERMQWSTMICQTIL